MLILAIAEDFDKLLENSCLTAIAALREFGRVVVVAVYISLVLVIAILGAKDGRTYRAGKVFDMVFAIESSDIGSAEGASTCMAEQVQSAEVIRFAKRVLIRRLFWDGEEFGCDDFTAVLNTVSNCTGVRVSESTNVAGEALKMVGAAQSAYELASQMATTLCAYPVGLLSIGSRAVP